MSDRQVLEIIKGAIDMHVHAAPDVQERQSDCIELVEEASKKGMGGILIKDHMTLTSDRAYILNKIYPDFKVYGAIALNYPVGGVNPAAAEVAIKLGCREIFMPTYAARNHVSQWGRSPNLRHPSLVKEQGISLIDERGRLHPEVQEVVRLIAEADIILGTGHVSTVETRALLRAARELGVRRILITHASLGLINMSVSDQIEAVQMGAYIEHSFVATTKFLRGRGMTSIAEMAHQIRCVGPEHCILSSDLGQTSNPSPVDGFEEFIRQMLSFGFREKEISLMVRENPKALLEG